jgi:Rad3-related DNA helicase
MERVITPIIIRNAAMELEEYMGTLENSAMKNSSSNTMQSLEEVQWAFEVIKLLRLKLGDYFRTLHSQVSDDNEIIVSVQEFTEKIHQACDEFEGLVGQMKLDENITIQPLIQRSQRLLRLSEILAKVVIDTESEEEASEPDSHRISYIFEAIEKFGKTSAFCMVFSPKGKEGKITTHLLDPGVLSGEIFAMCSGSILMSGTLYPPDMYADILSLPKRLTTKTSYKSPFAGERRPVLIAKDVTTRYNERSEVMWNRMRSHIQALIDGSEGHIAVFCPSYRLMEEIIGDVYFKGVTKRVESRDWSKDDIDKIVAELKTERSSGNRILLCGVFGARLSEGIDYNDGVLGSVVCIGIPNPPPSVLSNSLKQYVADKFGKENSWRYTVTQPAINSILQAMGRPIRSVEDRALILLLDKRNGDRTYTNCYPKSMKMNATNDPKTTNAFARRFFRRVKRN